MSLEIKRYFQLKQSEQQMGLLLQSTEPLIVFEDAEVKHSQVRNILTACVCLFNPVGGTREPSVVLATDRK